MKFAAMTSLVLVLTACASGGSAPATRTADPSSGTSGAVPALPRKDVAAITRAYTTFFAGRTSPREAATTLQHGSAFASALAAQAGAPQAHSLSAHVTSVSRAAAHPSPRVAKVDFALQAGGDTLLPGASGYAVRTGGRWQVAATTFCSLLQLQAAAPKQCDDHALTALPTR